jgi:phytoene desaturase
LHSEISRHFADPRLQLAFTFQGKYVGMSPFQCPSLFSILAFLEYEHGVFHPTGGCGRVSEIMADLTKRLGTEIQLDESVEEVLSEGSKATGVRTNKTTYEADAIVINADFADAMTRMVPDKLRKRWTDRKLEKKKYSCSTFMLYLGVEGEQPDVAHHTIYLSDDYQQNLRDIEVNHCLSDDPSVYVQNACVTDSTLAPKGHSTLDVLAPVSHMHENIDWQKEAPTFRKKVLQQLEKIGIRDVEKRIRSELMVTPADWQNDYHVYNGATFNLAHNLGQMLYFRPHNRFEDVDQVYLVGGGTHPGSGLPVIYSSARITTKSLLEDLADRGLAASPHGASSHSSDRPVKVA